MEHVLIAEAELQKCYAGISMDLSDEKHELEGFTPLGSAYKGSLATVRESLGKVFASGTDTERKYGMMLQAKQAMLENDHAAARAALDGLAGDELRNILLSPLRGARGPASLLAPAGSGAPDTDTIGSLTLETSTLDDANTDVLERLLAVQCQYFRGVCVEAAGDAYRALGEYVVVTTCFREAPFDEVWRTRAFEPFMGLAMYRFGVLCCQLAGPRAGELPASPCPQVVESLKQRLLHDSGVSLRMFLIFHPSQDAARPCGLNRRRVVLRRYMEVLEERFQRVAFRAAFSSDQYRTILDLNEPGRAVFCPENPKEDLLLCSGLLESLYPALPATRAEAQAGALVRRQRQCVRRLARAGSASLLTEYYESLMGRFAATAQLHGSLMLAYLADAQYERAYIAGHRYCQVGGREPATLLAFGRVCLLFGADKVQQALHVLERLAAETALEAADLAAKVCAYRAAALVLLARDVLRERPAEALQLREQAVQLLEAMLAAGDSDPELYLVLGFAHLELGRLAAAEAAIKGGLTRDGARAEAWYLLAVVRTAQQDHEGALDICNVQLDLQTHPGLALCVLKTALLAHYDHGEEAAELARAIFAYWVAPDSEADRWAGLAVPEPSSSGHTLADGADAMTLEHLKRRFLGRAPPDLAAPSTILSLAESTRRFPKTLAATKCELLGLAHLAPPFAPGELLALHGWNLMQQVREQGKRPGIAKFMWLWLSKLFLADQSIREAGLAAQAAYQLDELDPDVHYRLGRVAEADGRPEDAAQHYQIGLDLCPESPGCNLALARRHLALCPEDSSHLGIAYGHARAVLRTCPTDSRALGVLADCCTQLGLAAEAGDWYRRSLEARDRAPIVPVPPQTTLNFLLRL